MKISSLIYKNRKIILINIAIIGLIFLLPYYIFEGKLFIGGDDTRLYYIFPKEWIKNIAFFSWFNFSSVGLNNPNQFIIPILLLLIPINSFVQSPVTVSYFVFSSSLIFGLISFQLLISEIIHLLDEKTRLIALLGTLFYISSPILLAIELSSFLYVVWLIGLLPLISYLFIKFLKTGDLKYVLLAVIFSTVFSLALISVPWILGYLISLLSGLIASVFIYPKRDILIFLRRIFIFFGILALSQSFWFLSFVLNFVISDESSFSTAILSESAIDSFIPTVLSTATGNIIFPLLNLFHRQIAFDFHWGLENIFLRFYDKTFLLNLFFPCILLYGLVRSKKILNHSERKLFAILIVTFLSSLFFFTVNIGFLKSFFLLFGHIPGFVMFANFWSKFDLAYVLLYSIVITTSLIIVNRHVKNTISLLLINGVFFFLTILNFLPVKDLVNTPVWTTKNIYSNIIVPKEYTDFMTDVKNKVNSTSNVLSLPLNIASYSFIKGENPNDVFIGTSPVKLFTGINDFSGDLSFSSKGWDDLNSYIQKRDYIKLNQFLERHNINYIFNVKDIPAELKKSYLFNIEALALQDSKLLEAITSRKVVVSSEGNYELYSAKNKSTLFISRNIQFQKISPVRYKLYFKNLKSPEDLIFLDSFSAGWKLFLERNPKPIDCEKISEDKAGNITECRKTNEFFRLNDLGFTWNNSIFDESHATVFDYANMWTIDPKKIISEYSESFYTANDDGSINTEMTLYFRPQNYFYMGTVISIFTIFSLAFLVFKNKK